MTSSTNCSHHFNSIWYPNHVQRPSGARFMSWKHSRCVSGTYIVSLERTLCFQNTHCVSGRHIVSPETTVSLGETHCLSGRYIVSPEATLPLRKTHFLSVRRIVSLEDTLSFQKNISKDRRLDGWPGLRKRAATKRGVVYAIMHRDRALPQRNRSP